MQGARSRCTIISHVVVFQITDSKLIHSVIAQANHA